MRLLHHLQSGPNTLYVFEDEGRRILKINELSEIHSVYHPHDALIEPLSSHYWNFLAILPYLQPIKTVLLLGLGAGTISRQFATFHPQIRVTGIERDHGVLEIAHQYFDLQQPHLTIIHQDGVAFLHTETATYDVVILDAFEDGNLSPAFLTDSAFEAIRNRLAPGGILAVNYITSQPTHHLVTSLSRQHFRRSWSVPVDDSTNTVIIASNHDLDLTGLPCKDMPLRFKPLAAYMAERARRLSP